MLVLKYSFANLDDYFPDFWPKYVLERMFWICFWILINHRRILRKLRIAAHCTRSFSMVFYLYDYIGWRRVYIYLVWNIPNVVYFVLSQCILYTTSSVRYARETETDALFPIVFVVYAIACCCCVLTYLCSAALCLLFCLLRCCLCVC